MNDYLQFSALQAALLAALIAGITELLTRLRAKDYWVVATIVSAGVVGGLLAAYYDLDIVSGIAAGLGASGFIKTLGSIGNKSTPVKSEVIAK